MKKILYIFLLFFLIINLNLYTIKCESCDSSCSADNNCVGDNCNNCRYYETGSEPVNKYCILCDVGDSYFTFDATGDPVTTTCTTITEINGYKLIKGTKELVTDCPDSHPKYIGSICYIEAELPTNNIQLKDGNEYECKYSYTKEINDNLEILNCLSEGENFPPGFNYITEISSTIYQYSNECFPFNSGPAKITQEKIGNNNYFYCSATCPSTKKYYYDQGDNAYNCLIKCDFENTGDFSKGDICYIGTGTENCEGYIQIDPSKNIFECITAENFIECPNEYPYLYKKEGNNNNYCLKSCQYTGSIPFFGTTTYSFEKESASADGSKRYECVVNCPPDNDGTKYYKDNSALKIITDCSKSVSGPFHNDNDHTCYNSCEGYYKDLECVEDCNPTPAVDGQTFYYIYEETKTCYSKCPSNLQKGFYNSENKCVACNKTEGFYKANDKKCYLESDSTIANYYHNYDNNFLFSQECKEYSEYKYHLSDQKICYKSCLDIPSLSDKETIYEKDYVCYENQPNEDGDFIYKYQKPSSKILKYITEKDLLTECFEADLKYLKNNKCVNNCEENEYKVLPTKNTLGKCLLSSEITTDNCKFYNRTKICSNECKFLTIKEENGDIKVIDNENCVEECPNNYYKNIYEKTCTESCKAGFYTNTSSFECVSKCEKGFFETGTNGVMTCVEKCKKTIDGSEGSEVFANYLETGECQTSCPTGTFPFSFDTTNDHQLCLKNCPKERPYNLNNICLEKCDFYLNGNCATNCGEYNYIHPGNICSNDPCPTSAPFYYFDSTSTYKICHSNCPENYLKNYKTSLQNNNIECILPSSCEKVTYNNGCYNQCPEGLFNSNGICISKCNSKFYRDNNGATCVNNCADITGSSYSYFTASGECVQNCPNGENYIWNENECLSGCKDNYFYYEYESLTGYKVYKCVQSCGTEYVTGKNYYVNGTKECISSCGQLYVDEDNNICYENCLAVEGKSFSLEVTEGTYKCSESCGDGDNKYFGSDHICIDSCKKLPFNKTANPDNSCVKECDINSTYKFLDTISESLFCKDKCGDNKRYFTSNYICIDKCPAPNNFVVLNGNNAVECLSSCPDSHQFARYDDTSKEYVCSSTECNGEKPNYYLDKKICVLGCSEDYIIENTNICTITCDYYNSQKLYYYIKDNVKKCVSNCKNTEYQYTSIDGKCVENCNSNEFYDENDLICRIRCPIGTKIDGQICRSSCHQEGTGSSAGILKYEDENGYCVDDCATSTTGYIYHNENEYQCLNNCSNLYIDDNICKISCESKYAYDKICQSECPTTKRYFKSPENICLTDCPQEYSFYIFTEPNKYECKGTCNAYIPNPNQNMNAKKCIGTCKEDYPYFIYETEGSLSSRKICYSFCPSDYPFYTSEKTAESENLQCYKECPDNYVYTPGSYLCVQNKDCITGVIKYESKKCIEQCAKKDFVYEKNIDGKSITFCVDNCTSAENHLATTGTSLKQTYENKCVEVCPQHSEEKDKNCICSRLFYYNKTTGYKNCLNKDLTLCETVVEFPIIKMYKDECIDHCDGILSLSGHECYDNSYKCNNNEKIVTEINGDKRCDCINKYYYIVENERNVKKCLNETEECPSSHSLFIKETKECVPECPSVKYNKKYGKVCVSSCPSSTEENSNHECVCSGNWYVSDNYDIVCLTGQCLSDKPLLVKDTNQCVSSCKGTGKEVYFNKTCIDVCPTSPSNIEKISSSLDPTIKLISNYYCKCKNTWYYNKNGYEICEQEDKSCNAIEGYNYKYLIETTKQCVNSCPDDYKYIFNNKCLKNCGSEQNAENNICKCIKLWKYVPEGIIECLNSNIDTCENGYLLIKATNECYQGDTCPTKYPLKFGKTCYETNKCPEDLNTKYDEINNRCICVNKWYSTSSNEIFCLSMNANCTSDYPYFNYETKECKIDKTDTSSYYEFNYGFYKQCPVNTKPKETDDPSVLECICDDLYGYWYYDKDSYWRDISVCAQEKCPDTKKYYVRKQKQCINKCPEDDYPFLYQNICYEKCPNLTEVSGTNNECKLKEVDTTITLEDLDKSMLSNIVELYGKNKNYNISASSSGSSIGQKIITTNATVEFYGVNKKNKGKTNQDIKSDLSYIDISECIEKMYKSNGMQEDEDIVILKYDVNKIPNKFLISPVEYKFVSSKTGRVLDASVCEHNSIRISYPVHDLINRYDKSRKKLRNLEYMKIQLISNNKDSLREKIDKGKEIIEEYNKTDIFDINDKIFEDICIAVEINGKDLIVEDRFNFFYPKLSLCENNCTYNRTDFINERIYCDCSYKTEFDFNREYSSSFESNTNEENEVKSKSNSNIEVFKCISNLKNSKSLSNNGLFIFALIMIVVQFILLLVIIIHGISSLSLKMKNKMEKNGEDYDKVEVNVLTTNNNEKKSNENKTTERNLNHPPKKNGNFGMQFIPQEYLFLFFNKGEKGAIKKLEKDSVPFKINYNTRILLEKKQGVNYDNINPRGPFPPDQNLLVVVDSIDDDIDDYLQPDDESGNKNYNKNRYGNKSDDSDSKRGKSKDNQNEKESFNIKQKPKIYRRRFDEFSDTSYNPSDENYSIYDDYLDEDEDESHEKGFIENLKKNQRLIKKDYIIAIQNKNKSNFGEILFTEIFDKIYIIKILLFTKKFEIFSLNLSVYLLCHILLLVLNTLFFDIKTIHKIWIEENYPGMGYYLGYGLLACIIIWIIYKIFLCLLNNNDKIKEILKMIHFNKKYNLGTENNISKKYNNLVWKIKFKVALYSVVEFLLLAFCFIYLSLFGTVYIGTTSRVFKAYGIALIEVLIIKILYGIALSIMRYVSLSKSNKKLYDVVLFMNTYIV